MNVCKDDKNILWPKAEFIRGHLYQWRSDLDGPPRLCCGESQNDMGLYHLESGKMVYHLNRYRDREYDHMYRDVTEDWCMKRGS